VVVPVYNQRAALPRTAPAVLALEGVLEVVYVDDGSTDGTAEWLSSLISGHPSARILRHPENRGRSAARNTGWRASRGEVVLFLDADVRPEPGVAAALADRHRQEGVVAVLARDEPEGLDPSEPYHRYLRTKPGPASVPPGRPLPLRYLIIGHTSVRRDALKAGGGFDEGVGYGEDLELAYRLSLRWPAGFRREPGALVHQGEVGTLGDRIRKLYTFGGALREMASRHPGLPSAAGLSFVASPAWGLLLSAPGFRLARGLLQGAPYAMQPRLVRYLLASAVALGYRGGPLP
jgi:glycosyltransferase involved in cell wall biosynthesis